MSEICIIVTIVVYLAAMLLVGFAYSKTNNDSAFHIHFDVSYTLIFKQCINIDSLHYVTLACQQR